MFSIILMDNLTKKSKNKLRILHNYSNKLKKNRQNLVQEDSQRMHKQNLPPLEVRTIMTAVSIELIWQI